MFISNFTLPKTNGYTASNHVNNIFNYFDKIRSKYYHSDSGLLYLHIYIHSFFLTPKYVNLMVCYIWF